MFNRARTFGAAVLVASALAASCGGSSDSEAAGDGASTESNAESSTETNSETAAGIRLVSATEGAEIQADPPEDLVILDVRTQEEFDGSHLEGATMIDFWRDDFRDQIAELDPDVPYLIYCNSGLSLIHI